MTEKIESYIEFKVKQNWLMGMARDENAADCGISTGSVTNIIKTFSDSQLDMILNPLESSLYT